MGRAKDSGGSTSGGAAGVQKIKRPYNLKTRIVSQLRRLFLWHPGLKQVRDRTRIERGVYQCERCRLHFRANAMRCDHIEPVIDPAAGFRDWDTYISRMFDVIPGGIQHLCKDCHDEKTRLERLLRVGARRQRKFDEAG